MYVIGFSLISIIATAQPPLSAPGTYVMVDPVTGDLYDVPAHNYHAALNVGGRLLTKQEWARELARRGYDSNGLKLKKEGDSFLVAFSKSYGLWLGVAIVASVIFGLGNIFKIDKEKFQKSKQLVVEAFQTLFK